jgi:hypothetical protein
LDLNSNLSDNGAKLFNHKTEQRKEGGSLPLPWKLILTTVVIVCLSDMSEDTEALKFLLSSTAEAKRH